MLLKLKPFIRSDKFEFVLGCIQYSVVQMEVGDGRLQVDELPLVLRAHPNPVARLQVQVKGIWQNVQFCPNRARRP